MRREFTLRVISSILRKFNYLLMLRPFPIYVVKEVMELDGVSFPNEGGLDLDIYLPMLTNLFSSRKFPSIVKVLPAPVCPYMKMVPLIPSRADNTIPLIDSLYTFSF
jgi:hypothetical protein